MGSSVIVYDYKFSPDSVILTVK